MRQLTALERLEAAMAAGELTGLAAAFQGAIEARVEEGMLGAAQMRIDQMHVERELVALLEADEGAKVQMSLDVLVLKASRLDLSGETMERARKYQERLHAISRIPLLIRERDLVEISKAVGVARALGAREADLEKYLKDVQLLVSDQRNAARVDIREAIDSGKPERLERAIEWGKVCGLDVGRAVQELARLRPTDKKVSEPRMGQKSSAPRPSKMNKMQMRAAFQIAILKNRGI